jgi:asparagine synthase (glutamine-hydrolysing)
MFRGVSTVPPATTLVFERGGLVERDAYWDFADVPLHEGGEEEAIERFTEVFGEVTRERLIGDVPYGLLLSGGIDSSLVASFICEAAPGLAAYTVATGDADDETEAARAVARHVGAELTVVPLGELDPVAMGARIPWWFDQPFFNDATFANVLLARAIAGSLVVGITGDGGDHAFSGTLRHLGDAVGGRLARAPGPLVAAGVAAADAGGRVTSSRRVRRVAKGLHGAQVDDRRRWLSLREHDLPIRHRALLETPAWRAGRASEAEGLAFYDRSRSPDHLNRLLYAETKFELPANDLLKVDRAAMVNSTAARSPFLDRRVIELAAGLPADLKRRGRTFKWLLREVARRRLPADVARLPKTGLAVPLRDWLRGPLGERVGSVLASPSFAARGVYDQRGALTALERHRSGRGDYGHALWTMALTELWYRSFVDTFAEPDERIWE